MFGKNVIWMLVNTFFRIKKFPMEDLRYTIMMYFKLFIIGTEIILGSRPQFEAEYKKFICHLGNYAKRLTEKNGYINVPGCPPTKQDMLKYF